MVTCTRQSHMHASGGVLEGPRGEFEALQVDGMRLPPIIVHDIALSLQLQITPEDSSSLFASPVITLLHMHTALASLSAAHFSVFPVHVFRFVQTPNSWDENATRPDCLYV